MIAQICNLNPGEFIWTGGDCHLYLNHLEQARLQVTRSPLELPQLVLDTDVKEIDEFSHENIQLIGYEYHDRISAEISI